MHITRIAVITCLSLTAGSVLADLKTDAQNEANKLARALVKQDYKTVAALTHPVVVKSAGGIDAIADLLARSFSDNQIAITRMQFTQPSQLNDSGKLLMAKLPYSSTAQVQEQSFELNSFYVGFSANQRQWYFVDCEGITQDILKQLAPGYNGKLNLDGC